MQIVFMALALLGVVTPIGAEESEDFGRSIQDGIDRFQLWNACGPINLLVESPSYDAGNMGLTREAIATTVRSRLRSARLYGSSGISPGLYVNVSTVTEGIGFNVGLYFRKRVFDPISGQDGVATTWHRWITGQGPRDVGYILSSVSRLTDMFIDEYLRVNEPACSRSPIDP